jgi:hypothetical protein
MNRSLGLRFRSEVHCRNCADGNFPRRSTYLEIGPLGIPNDHNRDWICQRSAARLYPFGHRNRLPEFEAGIDCNANRLHIPILFAHSAEHTHRVFAARMVHNEDNGIVVLFPDT